MQVLITFKNVESSDDIKNYLEEKLKRFEKLIPHHESVHAVLRLEKSKYVVDINLVAKKNNIHASNEGNTFNEAIDLVLEKIRKQLVKMKEKKLNHR